MDKKYQQLTRKPLSPETIEDRSFNKTMDSLSQDDSIGFQFSLSFSVLT
jgi:hypothetical protein